MSKNSNYKPKDNTGVLFYDAPGAPTMSGNIESQGRIDITGEPATDKNQKEYTRISGEGVNGALYPNEYKTEDRHPAYTGPITVKGKELRVAAWVRQTKTGENAGSDFLSLAISEKRDNQK
jgi:hypothetical protein